MHLLQQILLWAQDQCTPKDTLWTRSRSCKRISSHTDGSYMNYPDVQDTAFIEEVWKDEKGNTLEKEVLSSSIMCLKH